MVILILIDFQYFQNIVSSSEKGSIGQNHSSSVSHHPVKPPNQFTIPLSFVGESPYPLRYLEHLALFCCSLFSKERLNPIRSTRWWKNNVNHQPRTFSIVLKATSLIFL